MQKQWSNWWLFGHIIWNSTSADLSIKIMQLKFSPTQSYFPTISQQLAAMRSACVETAKSKSMQATGVTGKPQKIPEVLSELHIHHALVCSKRWPQELTSQADSRVWAADPIGQFLSKNISGGQHLNKVQVYQNTFKTCFAGFKEHFSVLRSESESAWSFSMYVWTSIYVSVKNFVLFIWTILKLFFLETYFSMI